MRDIFILFLHAIVIIVRLARPGGLRSVVAESVLMRHQVLILNRGRKRAPNLRASDRIIAGLCTLLIRPARVLRSAIALRPSVLVQIGFIGALSPGELLDHPSVYAGLRIWRTSTNHSHKLFAPEPTCA